MATRIPNADGNVSSTTIWDTITNTPTLHGSTNITINNTGTASFSTTYTAPNTTNAATGCLFYCGAVGSAGTLTVTLQESSVDTAATASIAITSLTASGYIYLRFGTPYVFTTTGAGAYRMKFTIAGGSGTTTLGADSGASLVFFEASDNRVGALSSTDELLIVTASNSGIRTITMDGTQTLGNGSGTGLLDLARTIPIALHVLNNGLFNWNTAASATLTLLGSIKVESTGEIRMGTVATPYPTGKLANLIFNENGTSGNFGMRIAAGGKCTLQGELKTTTSLWKTTLSSGTGTTGSPLVTVDAVDWAVNDEIVICASSGTATNYSETETKFIKTKNSSTSYVLSNTAGGVEAGLVNTHIAGTYIVNITRNIVIETTNTAQAWWYSNDSTVVGDVQVAWCRFNTCGSNTTSKFSFNLGDSTTKTMACDYCVLKGSLGQGFLITNSTTTNTHTGLIAYSLATPTANQAGINLSGAQNKTMVDCFAIKCNKSGIRTVSATNNTFTRCVAVSTATDNSGDGGFLFNNSITTAVNSCESHACRQRGFMFVSNCIAVTMSSCLIGTKGDNKSNDVNVGNYNNILFNNCLFGSSTLIGSYLTQTVGSIVYFHKYNQTDNNHRWYTVYGSAQSTGTGLSDTTVRTSGSLALRLSPENNSTGFSWSFKVLAKANSYCSVAGFLKKNATFGSSTLKVDLYLPGSTTPDATQTMGNDTNWNVFNLAASYTGSVNLYATVTITAISSTAGAYVYLDDIFNGTNTITALDVWDQGQPSSIMFEQLGDAAAVWAVLQSTQTTSGTMGNRLKKALTVPLFLGLK